VDRQGYLRFRNWRIYGERGLVGRPTETSPQTPGSPAHLILLANIERRVSQR
jgi:hypothetical protein